jgi:hypothetical protein
VRIHSVLPEPLTAAVDGAPVDVEQVPHRAWLEAVVGRRLGIGSEDQIHLAGPQARHRRVSDLVRLLDVAF